MHIFSVSQCRKDNLLHQLSVTVQRFCNKILPSHNILRCYPSPYSRPTKLAIAEPESENYKLYQASYIMLTTDFETSQFVRIMKAA